MRLTRFTCRLARYAACTLLLALLGATSCVNKTGSTSTGSAGQPGVLKGPGIEFKRVGLGLPTETLDFAGTAAGALAGAKESGDVFFGTSKDGNVKLYRRNVKTNERTFVIDLQGYMDSSLATTPDGKTLTYCRVRPQKDVIDDPKLTEPENLAIPCIMDVKTAKEQVLFDFNAPDWRRWRAGGFSPFISPDGQRVYVLAYDMDRLLLQRNTADWLSLDANLQHPNPKVKAEDLANAHKQLEGFVTAAAMRERLSQAGVAVDDKQPVTNAVRAAIRKLHDNNAAPEMALLIWEGGKGRILPLQPDTAYADRYHYLAAGGNSQIILAAQQMEGSPYAEQPLFACDLQSGKLSQFGKISGLTKLVVLDKAEKELRVCYSPVRGADRTILRETDLMRLPLAGGAPVETALGGDYLGIMDLDESGQHMVGQDQENKNLYLVETATGKRTLINEQMAPLTGLFLLADASALIYLEAGITYKTDLTGDPATRQDRVTAAYFAPYLSEFTALLTKVGFTPAQTGFDYHWEEREGMGVHTVALEMNKTGAPQDAVLMRYDVKRKSVTSVWFTDPTAYPFAAQADLQGKDFDYYDAEKLATKALDRTGWIPAASRSIYQPGPNPLYDKKSDSYVITFRDGYTLKKTGDKVYGDEATLRITAKYGKIAEMTLVPADEVQDQPLKIERQRLPFLVKNLSDQEFPDTVPVKVEADKARLIVYAKQQPSEHNGVMTGTLQYRLCWEVDTTMQPQGDLLFTNLLDTETGERLGSLSYVPVAPTATTVER